MRRITLLLSFFLVVSTAALATPHVLNGRWSILAVPPLCFVFWSLLRRQSVLWRSSCLLAASAALAAVGVMLHLSVAFMALCITASLAAWDLVNLQEALKLSLSPEGSEMLIQSHLRSLFSALAAGVILTSGALLVRLDLPFAAAAALALLLVAALTGAARWLPGPHR